MVALYLNLNFISSLLQITSVRLLFPHLAAIDLGSDAIAPFVWLTAPGFSGMFSDNGFLMADAKATVHFVSWVPISDVTQLARSLSIRSLMDVYT